MIVKDLEYAMDVEDFDSESILLFVSSASDPCALLLRAISDLEDDQEPTCYLIEADSFGDMFKSLNVSSVPTAIYVNRGQEVERASGDEYCYDIIQGALEGSLGS